MDQSQSKTASSPRFAVRPLITLDDAMRLQMPLEPAAANTQALLSFSGACPQLPPPHAALTTMSTYAILEEALRLLECDFDFGPIEGQRGDSQQEEQEEEEEERRRCQSPPSGGGRSGSDDFYCDYQEKQ